MADDGTQGSRMLEALPAVYAESDTSGDLARLLGVFEELFFHGGKNASLIGIEKQLFAIPSIFLPGTPHGAEVAFERSTRERLIRWLANLVGFTPQQWFDPSSLERILGKIVRMYSDRGTSKFLVELLELCFQQDIEFVHVDDRLPGGFILGKAVVGRSTRLSRPLPYRFEVRVGLSDRRSDSSRLEQGIRAVIDFAKPAHTSYELHCSRAEPPLAESRP